MATMGWKQPITEGGLSPPPIGDKNHQELMKIECQFGDLHPTIVQFIWTSR